jgi:uncharacterized membrane protein
MSPSALTGARWESKRLAAFSDAVMAVIITLMAVELRTPDGSSMHALGQRLPDLLIYALSFMAIGMSWNHHHHLFRSTEHISAAVMWANLHLLFWLSLVPLVTKWVGSEYRAHLPASAYGVVALGSAVAYGVLVRTIAKVNGKDSAVSVAVGSDIKGVVSIGLYLLGACLAWVTPWLGYGLYVAVAIMWFLPDRRFARGSST